MMENKLLKRVDELTSEINELVNRRETLIRELRGLDLSIEIKSSTVFELKNLLESKPQD